jgi:Dna[CI] antecedent, DciA
MLAQLIAKGHRSAAQLKAIDKLLPDTLRSSVSAGPIEDGVWCLLVKGNAVAAKLRQLLPAFEAHLRTHGFETVSIRLKVSTHARGQ